MLSPDYIVGIVDGEGSFTVYIKNPSSHAPTKRRVRAEPKFYLKLIERDKHILNEMKKFFGCGKVYFQKDSRKNHQDCYRYEVANRTQIEDTIIPFFKKYPLRLKSKKNDFLLFCRIVMAMKEKRHLTDSGLKMLFRVKKQMH